MLVEMGRCRCEVHFGDKKKQLVWLVLRCLEWDCINGDGLTGLRVYGVARLIGKGETGLANVGRRETKKPLE